MVFRELQAKSLEAQALAFFALCATVCMGVTVASLAGLGRGGTVLAVVTAIGALVNVRNTRRAWQALKASQPENEAP